MNVHLIREQFRNAYSHPDRDRTSVIDINMQLEGLNIELNTCRVETAMVDVNNLFRCRRILQVFRDW